MSQLQVGDKIQAGKKFVAISRTQSKSKYESSINVRATSQILIMSRYEISMSKKTQWCPCIVSVKFQLLSCSTLEKIQ